MKIKHRGWKRKGFILAFLAPTLIAFALFYLYPIVTVFVTSFCKWDYTNITSPEFFGFADMWNNYKYIFELYPYFWEALKNSSIWALLGVFVQIPIATMIAIALSRKVKGVKFVRNVYIIPNMISTAAMGMIFLQLYSPLYGVVNPVIRLFKPDFTENILLLKGPAFIAMTCAYIFFTGTTTLMILGNIMAIPEDVREAAMLDGASGLRQDLYITVPMIKDTLRTVSILAATAGFLLYNEVYFLTKGAAGTYSISYVIRELAITSTRTQFGRANAVAVVQILAGMVIIVIVNLLYSGIFRGVRRSRKGGQK
ncbi:carbohydrate ABC transporter permease [Blautia sp. XA-2221]|uniref:carbohydrate ABC transporter permease n=1 Tax=Blautia sp. XA-2221 TaxID=2903961 RepID=UPI0023784748|nr:sugar ABC transporter permease [Blautia sp. XA-2221]